MNGPERAQELVLAWARRYTRGLPEATAERRLAELASDCHEQRCWGREVGAPPAAVAASMVARTLAGMPADLLWRYTQIAAAQDRPLGQEGRSMGRLLRSNWWLVLAGLAGSVEVALGASMPLEDFTVGATLRGVFIAGLGVTALAGIVARRRRRVGGDLMIAAGMLPLMPWMWTVVLPIAGLTVIVAAMVDAADAAAAGRSGHDTSAAGPHPWPQDRVLLALVGVLAAVVFASVIIREEGPAFVLVTPVFAATVSYLALRRRLGATPLILCGAVLVTASLATAALVAPVGLLLVDDFEVPAVLGTVINTLLGIALLAGGVALFLGLRKARDRARPA